MDQRTPWGFFDRSAQGDQQMGGCGIVFHLTYMTYFQIKYGMGCSTNNHVELMGLKLLLLAVIEKSCGSLQVFGDSMIIINWEKRIQRCHNTRLQPLIEEFNQLLDCFNSLSIAHVYRDQNQIVDKLSKEGSQLLIGQAQIDYFSTVETGGYCDCPFQEGIIFGR